MPTAALFADLAAKQASRALSQDTGFVLRGGGVLPKKQIPLRLSDKLYDAIAAWAEDDFRSVNGQIEYLLTECVRQRKKNGRYVSEHLDEPPELDIE